MATRHCNLVELQWDMHVHSGKTVAGLGDGLDSIVVQHTKTCQKPVEFFLADALTIYLWHHWCELYQNKGHKFVFPKMVLKGKGSSDHEPVFDWSQPFTHDNHSDACLDCAIHAGYQIAEDVRHGYTSNCVRRGIAATLGEQWKMVLARHNNKYGRAVTSRMDLDVYCPDEIWQEGGPLFGDIDGIEDRYYFFLNSKADQGKLEKKCTTCGFPDCACAVCIFKNSKRALGQTKSNQSGKHTCLLQGKTSGQPPKNGFYNDAEEEYRQKSWEAVGVALAPAFHKQVGCSGYYFPEELEQP